MPKTSSGKRVALKALEMRREHQPLHVDNSMFSTGQPTYHYCRECGHLSDVLPAEALLTMKPKDFCGECQALKEHGWLQ